MTLELENIILTIDTHEEANKQEKTRVKLIENWFGSLGAMIEHEELSLCDYALIGKFRGNPINFGIEYKAWDNFLTDSIDDMEDKLTRSQEIYDTVALFIEAGNYTFKPDSNGCHCILDYSGATKMSMKQNGNPEPQSKTLASFEGFCDTLQSNGIHVRQLRSEDQFPYSVYNLLVYSTKLHRLKIKTMTYEHWLLNHYLDLPSVGIVKAKKLILRYPNPFWIASASEESLVAVLGKVTGQVVYQSLRSHELETKDWKNNYFKDGTDIRQCPTNHRSCDQMNAYDCIGTPCEHHPDHRISSHNNLQSQCDPTEGTFLKIPLHSQPSVDDNYKSTGGLLPPIIPPVPISNHSGLSSFSTPQSQPHDTQDVPPSPKLSIQRPVVQGTSFNTITSLALVPAIIQKKDSKKKSSSIIKSFPSSAITSDEYLFGKDQSDWEPAEGNKMNLRANIETYLTSPHTLQECVDQFDNFAKGTVWEHVMKMKNEGIVTEFDNKTFVLKVIK